MTNIEFAAKAKDIAENYKTAYMLGTWGWPITGENIERVLKQYPNNLKYKKQAENIGSDGFMFDCCGLIKGILWGWYGDRSDIYGGAPYKANDVPDINEADMFKKCIQITSNFTKIDIGEYLWTDGHCGVYIGGGLAVEATPAFKSGVQITAVGNMGAISGYDVRTWKKHGKLPYLKYANMETKVNIELKELSKGCCGEQVRSFQQLLISKGFSCGKCGADGEFGDDTYKAVINFQKYNKSCAGIDGIVGVKTWKTILG